MAFAHCSGLTAINVDAANPAYSSTNGIVFTKNQTTLVAYPGGKTGSYVIPNSVTTIGEAAFEGCDGLTSVTIPNSVTTIDNEAFDRCISLTGDLIIPNSVTSLGKWAFCDCTGLTSVIIGNSVITIGQEAFYRCSGLTSVTNLRATPQDISYYGAFSGVNIGTCTLRVPASAVNAYKSAAVWRDFGNIVGI